jgi:hypothetical protein
VGWIVVWSVPLGYALYRDLGHSEDRPSALLEYARAEAVTAEVAPDDPEQAEARAFDIAAAWLNEDHAGLAARFGGTPFGSERGAFALPEVDGLGIELGYDDDDRLAAVTFRFDELEQAADVLRERWGVPRIAVDGDRVRRHLWFNEVDGVRAVLTVDDGSQGGLTLTAYRPMAELIGADGPRLGFERSPLLGARRAEVEQAFARVRTNPADPDRLILVLPPTEYERAHETTVDLWFEDGRVASIHLGIGCDLHPGATEMVRVLAEQKWGAPAHDEGAGADRALEFTGPPAVALEANLAGAGWTITIER